MLGKVRFCRFLSWPLLQWIMSRTGAVVRSIFCDSWVSVSQSGVLYKSPTGGEVGNCLICLASFRGTHSEALLMVRNSLPRTFETADSRHSVWCRSLHGGKCWRYKRSGHQPRSPVWPARIKRAENTLLFQMLEARRSPSLRGSRLLLTRETRPANAMRIDWKREQHMIRSPIPEMSLI